MQILEITNDLKGKQVTFKARIEKVIFNTGANGMNYLILHLVDSTARVEARLWNVTTDQREELKLDSICEFNCVVNIYHNQLQLKIDNFTILNDKDLARENLTADNFAICAPINVEKILPKMKAYFESFSNETYKKITCTAIEKYTEQLSYYPAAMSIHHNVISGLLWHSTSLVEAARGLSGVYKYAQIDWELVSAGAFLHDIGKIYEIASKNGTDYSLEGKLLGHISIGNTMVVDLAKQCNVYYIDENKTINPSILLLQHVILASHGKKDYGSPVEPNIIEAIIVSTLDNLDARIYRVNDELQKIDHENWTTRLMTEDNRMFYRHKK